MATHKTQHIKREEFRLRQKALFVFIEQLSQTATDQKITKTGDQREIVRGSKIGREDAKGEKQVSICVGAVYQILCANHSQSHGDQHPPGEPPEERPKDHTYTDAVKNTEINQQALIGKADLPEKPCSGRNK